MIVSNCNVVQVYWADKLSELPIQRLSIAEDYDMFLQSVADWIAHRRQGRFQRQTNLAMNVIRNDGGDIFGGVGKYLGQELYFYAGLYFLRLPLGALNLNSLTLHKGLNPALTEAQLFDKPSRVARFLMALHQKIIEIPAMW